ncbi:heterokaryon incompatibility protein HET-C [Russula earlei]|uniref:Heterokaryon incompatibility protein HET-C n=1 Tax=Russula earlei TaxID=71964 RepID=A0ACC0U684_9AGAM|nr:heterokaryon incompatibility protein HET-C [Russula earlei]
MSSSKSVFLILFSILVVCLPGSGVHAFGAGNIPSFAYLEGRAFRHGDIEDTLSELAKKTGGFALGALIGKGGSKFGGLDIKRVYFGNWLRDYSQAVDIASLKKVPLQTIINLCMALGFFAHGYATEEFEVTVERLGVYLPVEHIDNPKGYGNGEDARHYDRRLRGPVDPRELEVDPRTGMKNYIANESGSWDTSKAFIRRTVERCIHIGRQHRAQGRKQDEYEAYRLLGQALHTLEDFTAHSNFCELALVSMGHSDVFVHVGEHVRIQAPDGRYVAPLVTGTFGSSDFLFSLLGEASDHISEASVSDLNKAMDSALSRSASVGRSPADTLRDLLFRLPGGAGSEMARDMKGIERIRDASVHGGKPPGEMSPQELHTVLWQVLCFRDSVVKVIENTIEKIPGLGPLIEKIKDSISVFVLTTLEPFLKPILSSANTQLMSASSEVINNRDQWEVFDNPGASDPTHSFLSKDHFDLILNEPAGYIAKIVVKHTVALVIKALDDNSVDVRSTTDEILQCLFHPDFQIHNSQIQREMLDGIRLWLQSQGPRQSAILARLSKQSVRDHRNVRLEDETGSSAAQGPFETTSIGSQTQGNVSGYMQRNPGIAQAQGSYNMFGGGLGGQRESGAPETTGLVAISSILGGGQASNLYGNSPGPFSSRPNISYPGGPPSGAPPAHPQYQSYSGSYNEPPYGYQPPFQTGFSAAPEQSSYLFPGSVLAGPGLPYPGGPPPSPPRSSYLGSSYPGQSSYSGQQGTVFLRMPSPGDSSPGYESPPVPPSNQSGTAHGFSSQGGPHFPDPDSLNQSAYGSASHAHGTYRPEY